MKSKLLSILLVFVVSLARSQDWAPIKTGPKYLYGINTKLPSFGQIGLKGRLIIPVKLDTVSGSASVGFVFGAKDTLYKDRNGKWIGGGLFSNNITQLADGKFRISNFTFLPGVTEGKPVARLYDGPIFLLEGYAMHKRTATILGQPDSIVNILWLSTGFADHPLENDTSFVLSKRFGLVKFRNFGHGNHFAPDPFSFFYGNDPSQFSQTVQLEGIPHLQLGIAELDSPPKAAIGDVRQVLTENHFDRVPFAAPCTPRQTDHTYEIREEICTDTGSDNQDFFFTTWKWKKGFCDSTFSPPIQATDSGTIGAVSNPFLESEILLARKIGYYPSQMISGRVFYGQFKAETGIGFRYWISNGTDVPSALMIKTNRGADNSASFETDASFWWNSPCSIGFQPYNTQVQYPSYLKTGNHTEGNLLLISSVAGAKNLPSLHLTPNPATTELYISSPEKVRRISMVNTLGKTVKEITPDGEGRIGLAGLPAGVYLVRWWGVNGEGGTERVVKE